MKDDRCERTLSELPECGTYPHPGLTSNPVTEKSPSKLTPSADHLPACGLFRRLASMVYDSLLVAAVLMVAAAALIIPYGSEIRSGTLWFQIYLVLACWAYFAVCWRMGGQTVGMRAWRIRLVTADGRKIGWAHSALRFFAAVASAAPAGLGFFWSLFEPRRRTWHDLASSTRLVVEPKPEKRNT